VGQVDEERDLETMSQRNMSSRALSFRRLRLIVLVGAAVLGALVFWGSGLVAAAQDAPAAGPGETVPPPQGTPMYLPLVAANPTPVATLPPRVYAKVPVEGGSLGWPADKSPDTNLSLRGYRPTTAYLGLINMGGDTHDDAPQLAAAFGPARLPAFTAAFQVYDWDWNCNPPPGCRGNALTDPYAVTLLEMRTTPGEQLLLPSRRQPIYGSFVAMVLYAEERRLTLTYTRDDSPANGYVVHFEDVVVAPELLALYRQLNAAGRRELPALRNGEIWGMADRATLKLAIRDRGTFMDPRTCKDWWVDYRSQCIVYMAEPATVPFVMPTGRAALAPTPILTPQP
jgi:hypothetical protein